MRTAFSSLAALVLLLAPGTAEAGRTFYGWLFGTEVMPERGVEIQSWIDEENGRPPTDIHWTSWGFNALVGATDRLSVGFPLEFVWRDSDVTEPTFVMDQFGIEARYRFVSNDPVEAPPFAPVARLAVKRDVRARSTTVVEADVIVSTTTETGSVHALVDVGFYGAIDAGADTTHLELRPGAGVSFKVVGDVRLGVEGYSELSLDDKKKSWVAAGPNFAWTHGRFWLSASFGIGLYQIKTAPRAVWGIMF